MQDMATLPSHGDLDVQLHVYQGSKEEELMHQAQEHSLTVAEAVTCRRLKEFGEGGPGRLT